MHDVVEDSDITLDQLRRDFPPEVIRLVSLLTHEKGVSYFDYIRRIKTDPVATEIKKADLLHNMDTSRLQEITPGDEERLKGYRIACKMLLEGSQDEAVRIVCEYSECPYHSLRRGQEFIVRNDAPAFCARFWNLLYPDICVLLAKEKVNKKDFLVASCPKNRVRVRAERVEE